MIRTVIIGGGNVAFQFASNLLANKEISLVQVVNRTLDSISYLDGRIAITDNFSELADADIYLIAVSDHAIAEVAAQLRVSDRLMVHTSGATSMHVLPGNNAKGVFYIPQTFSKQKLTDLSDLPACIDALTEESFELLRRFGQSITNNVYRMNDLQRCYLHAAAVFVNNFVNHLYSQGMNICRDGNVDFEILMPLIQETAKKIVGLTPVEVQTGPAKRNDTGTMEKHLKILNTAQQELYTTLSKSIIKTYEKKL